MHIRYKVTIRRVNNVFQEDTLEFLADFYTAFAICYNHRKQKEENELCKNQEWSYEVLDISNGHYLNVFAGVSGIDGIKTKGAVIVKF